MAPVGALGPVQGEHVHRRIGEPALQPQADELPRVDVHLSEPPAVVPRPAAALQRVRPAPPQRALRDAERADPRPPVHPGRRAPVRPAGPADGRDPGTPRRGPRGLLMGGSGAALRVRDQARQGARRSGALGARRAAHPRGVRVSRHLVRPQAEGRHVLRAEDRHLHRRRARARMADGDHPGRPRHAARAVRPDLHRRERPAAAPDRDPPGDLRVA